MASTTLSSIWQSLRLPAESSAHKGMPSPSTARWRLVAALARSVGLGPTSAPLFWPPRWRSRRWRGSSPGGPPGAGAPKGARGGPLPHAGFLPVAPAAPAGHAAHAKGGPRQHGPGDAALAHEERALPGLAVIGRRPSAARPRPRRGKQVFDLFPPLVADQRPHARSLAKQGFCCQFLGPPKPLAPAAPRPTRPRRSVADHVAGYSRRGAARYSSCPSALPARLGLCASSTITGRTRRGAAPLGTRAFYHVLSAITCEPTATGGQGSRCGLTENSMREREWEKHSGRCAFHSADATRLRRISGKTSRFLAPFLAPSRSGLQALLPAGIRRLSQGKNGISCGRQPSVASGSRRRRHRRIVMDFVMESALFPSEIATFFR